MRTSSEIVGRISRACFVPARVLTRVSQLGAVAFAWCLVLGSWAFANVGLNWPAKKRIATRIGRGLELGAVLVETKAPLRWKSARAIQSWNTENRKGSPGKSRSQWGRWSSMSKSQHHIRLDRDLTLNHWQPRTKVAVSRCRRP